MGLVEKATYTLNAVNDISLALKEKNIKIDPIVLKKYGDVIRILRYGSDYSGITVNGVIPIKKIGYDGSHLDKIISIKNNVILDDVVTIIKQGYDGNHLLASISSSYTERGK